MMRRSLALLGFATLLMAACHTNSPGTMGGGDEMPPMMYKAAPAAATAPAARSMCGAESPRPAACEPVESR